VSALRTVPVTSRPPTGELGDRRRNLYPGRAVAHWRDLDELFECTSEPSMAIFPIRHRPETVSAGTGTRA
jgi:hypothetical protein